MFFSLISVFCCSFQDGTVLCLLLNKIIEGVIPALVSKRYSACDCLVPENIHTSPMEETPTPVEIPIKLHTFL